MKKISFRFYSYRPRLVVGLIWTTDKIPCVGDIVRVPPKYISQLDKKYFSFYRKDYSMSFKVKKRVFLVDTSDSYCNADINIELDWTDEEKIIINKYLKKHKK